MKKLIYRNVLSVTILSVLLFSSGCREDDSTSVPTPAERIQTYLDEAAQNGIPGAALYLKTPDYTVNAVSGVSETASGTRLNTGNLFRIASCSKTFIAALTMILSCEGLLNLDSKITAYLDPSISGRITNSDQITVRHLLNHTSGIYDYTDTEEFSEAVYADQTHPWTDLEVITFIYDRESASAIGEYNYSNSNYIITGIILDSLLGHHHSAELRSRILEPLGLTSTFYANHESFDTGRIVHGYSEDDGGILDFYGIDIGYGVTDGGVVANMRDLGVFIESLVDGAFFVNSSFRDKFIDEVIPKGSGVNGELVYGLGICALNVSPWINYGHDGSVPGYLTDMFYVPEKGVTLCLAINSDTSQALEAKQVLMDKINKLLLENE